jgi:hypothetical protein
MKSGNKRFAQKAIAVVVIVTMLYGAGVAPVVMMFVSGVVLVVFLVSRRSQNREAERIFDFYLTAEGILRDEERKWYGFEVTEVIEEGMEVIQGMPDPPPLHLFTLAALHHLTGNHGACANLLTSLVEDEYSDERYHSTPSPRLRRYVSLLRRIEAEPSLAPQTLGAIRSLERMRRKQASSLLASSRKALSIERLSDNAAQDVDGVTERILDCVVSARTSDHNVVRQPIGEVLRDIYPDVESPSN